MTEETFEVKVCWGSFSMDKWWYPNLNIDMSVEEQRRQNIENGFMTEDTKNICMFDGK